MKEKDKIYVNVCAKPKCPNKHVVMKPGMAKGCFVGTCGLCGLKQIERVVK